MILAFIPLSKAGKLEKAYNALYVYDYFKAKKLFTSLIKKQNAPAAYGLAIIYRRQDNPFHNIDSAVKYGALAKLFSARQKNSFVFKHFKVDSQSIQTFCDSIAQTILKKLEHCGNPALFENFLKHNTHVQPQLREIAFKWRDDAVTNIIVRLHQSDSTQSYLLRYPQHYAIQDLRRMHEQQVYEEQTGPQTEAAFLNYLNRYPQSSFRAKAEDHLFNLYRTEKDKSGLAGFVAAFPQSQQAPEAWKLLFSLSVKAYTNQELQEFLSTYPAFPYKSDILKEMELNNYTLIPFEIDGLQGYLDSASRIIIPATYDKVNPFTEGLALVNKGDSVFFINKENTNVFNRFFSDAYEFNSGAAPVMENGKWYLINRQGQAISQTYDEISGLSNGIYVVKQNNLYGALDKYAHVILQPRYSKIGDFKNEMAYFEENGLFGFMDKNGNITKPYYQWISDFNEYGIAIVQKNGSYGLTDNHNHLILPTEFNQIVYAGKNSFIVVKNNKYGYYSGTGCFLSEVVYDFKKEKNADYYTNGYVFRLIKQDEQAFMDSNGRISIDFGVYDDLSFAHDGLIRVKRKNKYGFVNRKLTLVVPYKYDIASDFKDSIAIAKRKDKTCLLNVNGEEIHTTSGEIRYLSKGYYEQITDGTIELLDASGKMLVRDIRKTEVASSGHLLLYLKDASVKVLKP